MESQIIATDVPGCREIVHDGENGILVPLKDSIALASAIKELINDSRKKGKEWVQMDEDLLRMNFQKR